MKQDLKIIPYQGSTLQWETTDRLLDLLQYKENCSLPSNLLWVRVSFVVRYKA